MTHTPGTIAIFNQKLLKRLRMAKRGRKRKNPLLDEAGKMFSADWVRGIDEAYEAGGVPAMRAVMEHPGIRFVKEE